MVFRKVIQIVTADLIRSASGAAAAFELYAQAFAEVPRAHSRRLHRLEQLKRLLHKSAQPGPLSRFQHTVRDVSPVIQINDKEADGPAQLRLQIHRQQLIVQIHTQRVLHLIRDRQLMRSPVAALADAEGCRPCRHVLLSGRSRVQQRVLHTQFVQAGVQLIGPHLKEAHGLIHFLSDNKLCFPL